MLSLLFLRYLRGVVLILESLTATVGMLPIVSANTAFAFFLDLSSLVNLSVILIYHVLKVMHFPCRVIGRSYHLLGMSTLCLAFTRSFPESLSANIHNDSSGSVVLIIILYMSKSRFREVK